MKNFLYFSLPKDSFLLNHYFDLFFELFLVFFGISHNLSQFICLLLSFSVPKLDSFSQSENSLIVMKKWEEGSLLDDFIFDHIFFLKLDVFHK
jgi:hypothetical protein